MYGEGSIMRMVRRSTNMGSNAFKQDAPSVNLLFTPFAPHTCYFSLHRGRRIKAPRAVDFHDECHVLACIVAGVESRLSEAAHARALLLACNLLLTIRRMG